MMSSAGYFCRLCKTFDPDHIASTHHCATNTKRATNTDATNAHGSGVVCATNKVVDVAKTDDGGGVRKDGEVVHRRPEGPSAKVQTSDRTANRRNRTDYNAYQRDLMRKRRAEGKA